MRGLERKQSDVSGPEDDDDDWSKRWRGGTKRWIGVCGEKAWACDVGLGDEIRLEENQDSRKAKEIGWMLV